MAKFVALGVPQKVQQKQMIFSWAEPGTASYHLTVQAPDFGGPQDYNAIHRRAIPALREQHGVAQDVVLSICKVLQDLRSIPALAVGFRRPKSGSI